MVNLNPFRRSKGDISVIESVGDHMERHFRPISWVMHEKESPDIHVVYVIEATRERNYKRLVTCGMSERPMTVPPRIADGKYAELTLCLPSDWPLSVEAFADESNYWPVRLLKGWARFPQRNGTWVYAGHSMDWSTPPQAFARNTAMTAVALMWPKLSSPEAQVIHLGKKRDARLWAVYPLYEAEADFKQKNGCGALEQLLEVAGVTELLNPARPSVVKPN